MVVMMFRGRWCHQPSSVSDRGTTSYSSSTNWRRACPVNRLRIILRCYYRLGVLGERDPSVVVDGVYRSLRKGFQDVCHSDFIVALPRGTHYYVQELTSTTPSKAWYCTNNAVDRKLFDFVTLARTGDLLPKDNRVDEDCSFERKKVRT